MKNSQSQQLPARQRDSAVSGCLIGTTWDTSDPNEPPELKAWRGFIYISKQQGKNL